MRNQDKLNATEKVLVAAVGHAVATLEKERIEGVYHAVCHEVIPGHEQEYNALIARIEALDAIENARLSSIRRIKWEADVPNTVVTVGKNFLLDSGMAGSAYTASFFMGLISLVSFSAISAADTQASHAGWLEAGGTNAPTYSGTRKTTAWSAASAGSKALSAGLVFTFTGSGTVKGCFLGTVNTVDGTTGTLFSAGLFSGGDQPVVSTNTLTVSYSLSL